MKLSRIGSVMFLLFVAAAVVFTQNLKRQDEKQNAQDLRNKGAYLVSLISLYPMTEFDSDKQEFFLRTLTEYTSKEGFCYLFIHDADGNPLVSLASHDMSSKIPQNIQAQSLATAVLTTQTYNLTGSSDTFFEFAKPFFKDGQRGGVVRLGLKLAPAALFTLERISLLAMIAFFLFAALAVGYHGITLALKPLKNLNQALLSESYDDVPINTRSEKIGRIAPIIEELERSLNFIRSKLKLIETDKLDLVSKLGVTTFEKNKIIKILDSLNFGIVITDAQENIDHINAYLLKLLNKTREEVMDQPLHEIIKHDEITPFITQPEMVGRAMTVDRLATLFPEIPAGEVFKVSTTYLMGSQDTPLGKIIFFQNITSEAIAEKAKHEFIAHVAHEILTPITNIKSYTEILMDGEVEDIEIQKEFYNTINEQTNRLADLIKNLLNISKIEMGSLTLNKGLVKTDWLFQDCISSIEASAAEKNITITKNPPDTFPSLMADKDMLKVAIINILGNALKYTPQNGNITFAISERDNMVIFDIVDTGYGISEKDLPHIFEKFYRSENPMITDQVGTGLGLAITAEIVHLHKGKIEVESELGHGTHVSIKIPKEEFYIDKS